MASVDQTVSKPRHVSQSAASLFRILPHEPTAILECSPTHPAITGHEDYTKHQNEKNNKNETQRKK